MKLVAKNRLWVLSAAALAGVTLARRMLRPKLDLRDQIVLITGGSRGLGYALAQEFGGKGARLALCARDLNELQKACDLLGEKGIEAVPFTCDIGNETEIKTLIEDVITRFGRIDVLVNNAGHIKVGPLDSFDHSDFEHAMNVMFWAPVNLTFAALPHMKQRRSGHIVNITSVGGRVSIPHLLPYSCAKFALLGFSTGLSAELRSQGIDVLTVVPGLMRTGSYLNAEFTGAARDEFAWFALLGNLPGFSIAANYAAACVRRAVETRRHTRTISLPANLLIRCEAFFPETTRNVLEAVNRLMLPHNSDEKQALSGKTLEPGFSRIFKGLTSLGKIAAHDLNE